MPVNSTSTRDIMSSHSHAREDQNPKWKKRKEKREGIMSEEVTGTLQC